MTVMTTCPHCRHDLPDLDVQGPAVAAFCGHCDQPLFWVSNVPEPVESVERTDRTFSFVDDPQRRQPELRGVESDVEVPCWQCRERVAPTAAVCHRCGARIPPPEPERRDDQPACEMPCESATGQRPRRVIDVPAPVLVVLGAVFAVAVGWLIGILV